MSKGDRAVTPVIATILMVAVVVVLATTISVYFYGLGNTIEPAPNAAFEQQLLDEDGPNERLEVTLTHEDGIRANRVLIVATEPVDIGGPDTDPNGGYATVGEKLTEGNDQSGVGDYWTAGETIKLGGVGDLSGITIRIVWNPTEVKKDGAGGREPSEVIGENAAVIWEHTVG
jgi:flagellin-like protein